MNITENLIEKGRINRPGTPNSLKNIVVHETANKNKGADAKAHSIYIKRLDEKTSWHYTVDDKSIYRHIPDNEKSYSTGDKEANESSIAIELCVNSDGDFETTKKNAAELICELMEKYDIPIENVKTHKACDGKNCPATLLKSGWDEFIGLIENGIRKTGNFIPISKLKSMGYTGISF